MRFDARFAVILSPLLGVIGSTGALSAQDLDWTTVEQGASWYAFAADQAISDRTSLWFDAQLRRMGLGRSPQQLVLRPGILVRIAPTVRIGGGYVWVATAPYGQAPSPTALREHRAWQQLTLTHRSGEIDVTHRYRTEQRWIAPVLPSQSLSWTRTHRARYLLRAQGKLPGVRRGEAQPIVFAWNELMISFGNGGPQPRVTQNRVGGGVGFPLSAHLRLEAGYMNLWNALHGPNVNEFNHTLTLSLIRTSAPN